MSKEENQKEMMYQLLIGLTRELKKQNYITDDEFQQVDKQLLKNYQPFIGMLLSPNSLTL